MLMALTAVSARLCDSRGRRRIMLAGYAIGVPWFFVVMLLTDSGGPILFGVGIIGTYAILGFVNGPVATFTPEIFPTRERYTGAGLAFNLGGILGGAIPPTSAGALMAVFGRWSIGLMMAIVVLVSLVCTLLLPETMGSEMRDAQTDVGS